MNAALKQKRHITVTSLSPEQRTLIEEFRQEQVATFQHAPLFSKEFAALTSAGALGAYEQAVKSLQANNGKSDNLISDINFPATSVRQAPQHTVFPSKLEAQILSLLNGNEKAFVSYARSIVANGQGLPSQTSSATTAASTSAASTATATPSSSPQPSHKSNTGPIVGGVVGGVIGLVLIAAIIFFFMRRHRRQPHFDIVSPGARQETTQTGFNSGMGRSPTQQSRTAPWSPDAYGREAQNTGGLTYEKRMKEQDMEPSEPSTFDNRTLGRDEESSEVSTYGGRIYEHREPPDEPVAHSEAGAVHGEESGRDTMADHDILPERTPDLPYHVGPYFPPER